MAKKIFETKKINMETLPEYLKAARESFSYELKHIAKITNISDKFLRALEDGHYHRLPADVYVYGFLRKLAELYQADSDLLISQYKKERGIHENINRSGPQRDLRPQPLPAKFVLTPRTMAISAAAVLILFVVGYIAYQVHAINQPPMIKVTDPADGSVVHASSIVLRGQTDAGASLSIDGQPVQVDSSGNFTEPISISAGTKVLTFVASNSFGKHSSKQISIIGDFSGANNATAAASQNFSLTVSDNPNPTVVTILIDGGAPEVVTLEKGDTKTFNANQKIILSTADAGSTYVQINGGQKFKLGKPGQSLSDLAFTAASANIGSAPSGQAVLGASTDTPGNQSAGDNLKPAQ